MSLSGDNCDVTDIMDYLDSDYLNSLFSNKISSLFSITFILYSLFSNKISFCYCSYFSSYFSSLFSIRLYFILVLPIFILNPIFLHYF